jgi:hypothetical protein
VRVEVPLKQSHPEEEKSKTKKPKWVTRSISTILAGLVLLGVRQACTSTNPGDTRPAATAQPSAEKTPSDLQQPARAEPDAPPKVEVRCPKCGGPMVVRHNRKTGEAFWGCRNFPTCRGTRPYKGEGSLPPEREFWDRETRRTRTTGEELEKQPP